MLILAGGLAGGLTLSQFPEFSQQYTQRLAGKVEELNMFVAGFDADAQKFGLDREQALADLRKGGAMGAARAETIQTTIDRRDRLDFALTNLRQASVFERVYHANAFVDSELAQGTLHDFKPAVPITASGFVFATVGFFMGAGLILVLLQILRLPFRARRHHQAA